MVDLECGLDKDTRTWTEASLFTVSPNMNEIFIKYRQTIIQYNFVKIKNIIKIRSQAIQFFFISTLCNDPNDLSLCMEKQILLFMTNLFSCSNKWTV